MQLLAYGRTIIHLIMHVTLFYFFQYIGVFGTPKNRCKDIAGGTGVNSEKIDMTAPVLSSETKKGASSEAIAMTAPVLSAGSNHV